MTLSDLAAIGSFISGVGVLVSLIYLALQIRQNTLTHRAAAYQSKQVFLKDQFELSLDPILGPLQRRVEAGDESLTDAEYQTYLVTQLSWFAGVDHLLWLRDNKVLDDVAFSSEALVLQSSLGRPAFRATWEVYKPLATPGLRRLVDRYLANPTPAFGGSGTVLQLWKDALATAKAGTAVKVAV